MWSLNEAVGLLDKGVKFGEVYSHLEDQEIDGPKLKFYFVHHRLPEGKVNADPENTPIPTAWKKQTEQMCQRCGGFLVDKGGSCFHCTTCGASTGGCG